MYAPYESQSQNQGQGTKQSKIPNRENKDNCLIDYRDTKIEITQGMIMETRASHAKSNKLREEDNVHLKPKYCNMLVQKRMGQCTSIKSDLTLKQT